MPEKYLRRDGIPILVRHTGRTTLPQLPPNLGTLPPVVCLHDAGLQSSVFSDLLGTLAPTRGAISLDFPGHGRSGSLDALPTVEAMSELAQAIASDCLAKKPILVGHGMGALVALEWALRGPATVSALVLCGLGLALETDEQSIETMRQVTLGKAPRPFDPSRVCKDGGREMMQRAYMEGIKTDPRATLVDLEASLRWSASFDLSPKSELACPVLVVSGASENEAFRRRAAAVADSCRQGSTATIEGAAHFLPLEQPAGLASEIERFAEAL